MSYFPSYSRIKNKIEVKLDLSNYATNSDLKNATDAINHDQLKKGDEANLKSKVDKLDVDKLKKNVMQ